MIPRDSARCAREPTLAFSPGAASNQSGSQRRSDKPLARGARACVVIAQLRADVEIVEHEPVVRLDELAAGLSRKCTDVACDGAAAERRQRSVNECHQRPNGGQR